MEYEKCYVFEPEDIRPAKRRRTEPEGLQASWSLRKKAFREAWQRPQARINQNLQAINATTIRNVVGFLDDSTNLPQGDGIPTALVLAGPNSALRTSITSQVAAHNTKGNSRILVALSSGASTNLKGVLKLIIQKATSRLSGADDDEEELDEQPGTRSGPKLLNYDLQALYDYVEERKIQQVVIAFEDTEAFDSDLLSELIELLGCWKGRIPFAFILNVATSVEFLQHRLSKTAVRCIAGKLFDAALSGEEIEQVFDALTESNGTIYLGPSLMAMILERQTDYIQSIDSFVQSAEYAYMSCYFANALSIFLDPNITLSAIPKDHFEALRHLASFRNFARQQLDKGNTKDVRRLLDSDQYLFEFVKKAIPQGRRAVDDMIMGTATVRSLQASLPNVTVSEKSSLYNQAMSGKLAASPLIRSLLLSMRKAPSDVTLQAMKSTRAIPGLSSNMQKAISNVEGQLAKLIEGQTDATHPLRSEDDIKNSTWRTTVVARKIELVKQKSTLSKEDAAYTTLIRSISDTLESYFTTYFIDPKNLTFHEIFIYNMTSPNREVFAPRPRHAIERALAAPHDYLHCDCCRPDQGDNEDATLASSQPATAVLYQLYLESGSLINASDLWQAFQAVMGDEQEDEQRTMALFQRALADLRYAGFVKSTRKRVDHIAKVSWRGL